MAECKTVGQLVFDLKENGEDFEWYPTHQGIVDCLINHLAKKKFYGSDEWRYEVPYSSILDIGCGNGSLFEKIDNTEQGKFNKVSKYASRLFVDRYGIEKSNILYEQVPDDVVMLGSDFYEQTLIDKQVGLIFCNPPYSDYETWTEKIIMQGNCDAMALVIPQRWRDNERISYALKKRNMKAEVLGSFDFENAERRARAKVDLLLITFDEKEWEGANEYYYRTKVKTDPFDVWFEETFRINAEKEEVHDYEREEQKKNELVEKGDTADMLVKFYNADMEKLYDNYRVLEKLDADIFKELKVNVKGLKESLKSRISGLKHVYWDMLFRKYNRITQRLTSKGRRKVIDKLNGNTAIDFTLNNIFQLTMWLIRNSNKMFDEQVTDFFLSLCNSETIHRYKSNLRWNDDDWRYVKQGFNGWGSKVEEHRKKLRNVQLDYRIVVHAYSNFHFSEFSEKVDMSEDCLDFLEDMYIIADNLGFDVERYLPHSKYDINLESWRHFELHYFENGERILFADVKLYKNGNRHVKFCKKFMQKLNVEMARINGWIQNKSQAMEEIDISEEEINEVWGTNYKILPQKEVKLLGF